jgi:hypothetical protein
MKKIYYFIEWFYSWLDADPESGNRKQRKFRKIESADVQERKVNHN